MKLTSITLRNFKGVGDEHQKVEIAPVTLLFGPNSAGKSTVLQALAYLFEVLERGNTDAERTELGGSSMELGGFWNLVHAHELNRPIGLGLSFSIDAESDDVFLDGAFGKHYATWEFVEEESEERFDEALVDLFSRVRTIEFYLEISWSELLESPSFTYLDVEINGVFFAAIEVSKDGRDARLAAVNLRHPLCYGSEARSEEAYVAEQVELVRTMLKKTPEVDAVLESWAQERRTPSLDEYRDFLEREYGGISDNFPPWGGDNKWFGQLLRECARQNLVQRNELVAVPLPGGREILRSDKLGLDHRVLWEGVDGDAWPPTASSWVGPITESGREHAIELVETALNVLILGPVRYARKSLSELIYIGPLRHLPDRTALAARNPYFVSWADGSAAWQVLADASEADLSEMSRWLSASDRFDSGFEVDVERFRALPINHPITQAVQGEAILDEEGLARELDRIPVQVRVALRNTLTGARTFPKDLGVGVSQLLPVIVAALHAERRIVSIEQPELHIHPRLQVVLGDLFLDRALKGDVLFLIETHSEHLMLRLLRRIRETFEDELEPMLPPVRPEQVAVNYGTQQEGVTSFRRLRIRQDGDFLDRWPDGFFGERAKELF